MSYQMMPKWSFRVTTPDNIFTECTDRIGNKNFNYCFVFFCPSRCSVSALRTCICSVYIFIFKLTNSLTYRISLPPKTFRSLLDRFYKTNGTDNEGKKLKNYNNPFEMAWGFCEHITSRLSSKDRVLNL
jgi:hypothetical protein